MYTYGASKIQAVVLGRSNEVVPVCTNDETDLVLVISSTWPQNLECADRKEPNAHPKKRVIRALWSYRTFGFRYGTVLAPNLYLSIPEYVRIWIIRSKQMHIQLRTTGDLSLHALGGSIYIGFIYTNV